MKKTLSLFGVLVFSQASLAAGEVPAIKNFRQIFQSISSGTGVTGDSPEIASYWSEASGRLPKNGEVAEVNTPAMLTLQSLSALFCKEMITKDAALPPERRRAHRQVDFSLKPGKLSVGVRESVVEEYGAMFWGRSPDALERILVLQALDGVAEGLAPTPTGTRQFLLLGCTLVASSVDSLTF